MAKRPEIPSDEELSEAAKKMTKKFEEQLSLTTGEALQISHPKVESMFFNYLKQAIPLGIEFFQKMEETPVETVQKQLFLDFLNEITNCSYPTSNRVTMASLTTSKMRDSI